VATCIFGSHGEGGNFIYQEAVLETGQDMTFVPASVILSHENKAISRYELMKAPGQPDDVMDYFRLENEGVVGSSGAIALKQIKPLDRETTENVEYKLNAFNEADEKISQTSVIVWVQDVNDEEPVVDVKTLRASVQEDVKIGTRFHTIVATDADKGFSYSGGEAKEKGKKIRVDNEYNKIVFEKADDSDSLIKVNSDGSLVVNGKLDRELNNGQIKFRVKVRDWPQSVSSREYFHSYHEVVIDVLDANDHAPEIIGGVVQTGSVDESASVGTSVMSFEATDADEGLNSEVTFKIMNGNDGGHFEVESVPRANGASKGTIVVKKPLDYEHGEKNFNLKIRAYNKDATNADDHVYYTEFTAEIKVNDVNEAPVFKNVKGYKGEIAESEPAQFIGKVVAVDEDEGQDDVSYNITKDPLNWFTIDEKNGEIRSTKPLDREDPAVVDGVYKIQISATDANKATNYVYYDVIIGDKNDNAPVPVGEGWDVSMCHSYDDEQMKGSITTLHVQDIDGPSNQGPFTFEFTPDDGLFKLEYENKTTMLVVPALKNYEVDKVYTQDILISDSGTPTQSKQATLSVRACSCGSDRIPSCNQAGLASSGGSIAWIIAIVVAMALISIIVVALVYQRRRQAEDSKQLLYDEDDIREHINKVNIEGGGEEDNGDFDIGILNNPDYLVQEKPLTRPDMYNLPEGTDVSKYINDAKDAADGDSGAPPFDSLLVFDFEGVGSEAGTLTSIGSGTTDGSHNYDYLHEWGPRFGKIADVYGSQQPEEEC